MHVYCTNTEMLNGLTDKGHLVNGSYYIYIWMHKHTFFFQKSGFKTEVKKVVAEVVSQKRERNAQYIT